MPLRDITLEVTRSPVNVLLHHDPDGYELRRFQIHHPFDNVRGLSHASQGCSRAKAWCASAGCIGVLMIPAETAFTRTPLPAYSIASNFVAAFSPPFVRDASTAGTLVIGWSTRLVVM